MGGSVMCVFGRRFMVKNMCLHENILYHFIHMGMRLLYCQSHSHTTNHLLPSPFPFQFPHLFYLSPSFSSLSLLSFSPLSPLFLSSLSLSISPLSLLSPLFPQDYKGHVMMQCSEGCSTAYHSTCWRRFKGDNVLGTDRDLLLTSCLTPDCGGSIKSVAVYDIKGLKLKVRFFDRYIDTDE